MRANSIQLIMCLFGFCVVGLASASDLDSEVNLRVVPGGDHRRLLLIVDGRELSGIDVPARVTDQSLRRGVEEALSSSDRKAVAVAVQNRVHSFLVAFVRTASGQFVSADISRVEDGNFGKLGTDAHQFRRFETKPVRWILRDDGLYQVTIQTAAWRSDNKRMVAAEPLIINRDGLPLFR
jgi:hypothetical protein